MKCKNDTNYQVVQVSSPQELNQKLDALMQQGARPTHLYVQLADPNLMLKSFHYEEAVERSLNQRIIQDMEQKYCVSAKMVEFDAVVLNRHENGIEGLFTMMPKKICDGYLAVLDKYAFLGVVMSPYLMGLIGYFFDSLQQKHKKQAVISVQHGHVFVGVFNEGRCHYMRYIPFDTPEEAKEEILNSLRRVAATSHVKHYDAVYYCGEADMLKVLKKTKGQLHFVTIEDITEAFFGVKLSLPLKYELNFLKKHTFSSVQSHSITKAVNVTAVVLSVIFMVNLVLLMVLAGRIHRVKSTYTAAELVEMQQLTKKAK